MKIIITLIISLGIGCFLNAQGNLQFNQVINTSVTGLVGSLASANLGTITVPAGKVWKVETASVTEANNIRTSLGRIGNNVVFYFGGSNSPPNINLLPLWLRPGTYNLNVTNYSSSALTYRMTLSAIEFNVIPD